MADLAQNLAAVGLDRRRGVALERMAEGVIRGQEEPAVAAGLHQRLAGAVGERPGVVGPVDRIGRALRTGQIRGGRARNQEHLVLFANDLADGERDRGGRHVDDDVDLVDVDPGARDVGADVGLVLMVGADDLDLHAFLLAAEILDRHLRGDDGAGTGDVGIKPRHVVQDADLGHIVGGLGVRRAAGKRAGDGGNAEKTLHPVCSLFGAHVIRRDIRGAFRAWRSARNWRTGPRSFRAP